MEIHRGCAIELVGELLRGRGRVMWLQALPPEHTEREAASLARTRGSTGSASARRAVRRRPAVAGACRRGYRVTASTGPPNSWPTPGRAPASERVTWEQRDMRDLPWQARFDGAFCVGNSFGYLDDEGNEASCGPWRRR